jgi:uncharacterized protein
LTDCGGVVRKRGMILPKKIDQAIQLLIQAAHPKRIILFGSYARGTANPASDVDFLVIERTLENKFKEMIRLSRVLRPLGIPVDILVVSQKEIDEWGHLIGTPIYWALKEGKIVHEEAA